MVGLRSSVFLLLVCGFTFPSLAKFANNLVPVADGLYVLLAIERCLVRWVGGTAPQDDGGYFEDLQPSKMTTSLAIHPIRPFRYKVNDGAAISTDARSIPTNGTLTTGQGSVLVSNAIASPPPSEPINNRPGA